MIGIFGVPPVLLLLMFISRESKMVFLSLWIISILLSALMLIFVEYKHERMQELLGLNGEESDGENENEEENTEDEG